MYYGIPKETIKSVTHAGQTYTKRFYKLPTAVTNVTDEAYPNWTDIESFAEGDFCIVPELNMIYRSIEAHSGSFPLSLNAKWTEWSAVNSACAFDNDENIGSKTTGTDMVFEIDFSMCDCIGLIDCKFNSVHIQEIDTSYNLTLFDSVISGIIVGCKNFEGYFTNPIKRKKVAVIDGLRWRATSKIILTFSGYAELGTIIVTKKTDLALTLKKPVMTLASESKILTSEGTNFRRLLRQGVVKVVDAKIAYKAIDYDDVADKVAEIMDKTVLWIPTKKEIYSQQVVLGYIERIPLPAGAENEEYITSDITLVGVQT